MTASFESLDIQYFLGKDMLPQRYVTLPLSMRAPPWIFEIGCFSGHSRSRGLASASCGSCSSWHGLFGYVGAAEFEAYHQRWWNGIKTVILVPGILAFAGGIAMLFARPNVVLLWLIATGVACEVVTRREHFITLLR